nr:unnamed protein product [Callosobruchus chinensis]
MKRCTNCLRRGHSKSDCRSQGCKKCNGRHNTLLHDDNLRNPPATSGVARSGCQNGSNSQIQGSDSDDSIVHGNNDDNSVQSAGLAVNHCRNLEPQILLSTANILIKDGSNRWHECRALLDSGSQPNFITTRLMSQLRLDSTDAGIPVIGVGNSTTRIAKRVRTEIKSLNNDYSVKLTFLVLDEITECMPNFPFNKTELKIPKTVKLADSNFYLSSTIDILLGAGIFFDLLCSGRIKLGENLPVLQQTLLGWIISGPLPREMNSSSNFCNLAIEASLDKQIEKFWLLEEFTTQKPQSREEIECENVFVETTRRDDSGHFVVTLPTRENVHDLGENLTNAVQRLYAMESKFSKNVEFKQLYTSFMNEYERLGHMTRINESELHSTTSRGTFYLPHYGVIKNESTTTKLRVVFDGSCKSSTGLSLNDTLKVGPKLQDDLVDILIRFRKHSYVIVADVEKMYRQVKIDENQRDLQRIVWRKNETDEIGHYRLNTVTYGTASASFLAVRSLQQVAHEHHESYPHAAEAILSDFYVDDLITGANDIESTINLKHDISILLDSYGFPLRKWLSNSPHILEDSIDNDNCYIMSDDDTRKTLGLLWCCTSDTLEYRVNEKDFALPRLSKRTMLSAISKIFDPLGIISPVIITVKIFIQELWQLKISWDDSVPSSIRNTWMTFTENLTTLCEIKLPRQVMLHNASRIELHGFCDASQRAYGACVYVKSIINDTSSTQLLCSKSRVAPLKTVSLPRLELCGALLLTRLMSKVLEYIKISVDSVSYSTDSSIVLCWISAPPPNTWKLFVSNRISKIQGSTDVSQWKHVASADNPADLVSRGISASQLPSCKIWWHGPVWLNKSEKEWPEPLYQARNKIEIEHVPEKRHLQVSLIAKHDFSILDRYSSLYRLQKIVAFCFRFTYNASNSFGERKSGAITVDEMNHALLALVKLAQHQDFSQEINCLFEKKPLPKGSRLLNLDPFLDTNGYLRVGGRLSKSNLPFDTKHPLILGAKNKLTSLIIKNEHHRQLHAGCQSILSTLRQRFWPLGGRQTVRRAINKCLTCFRIKPNLLIRKMADLPAERVTQNRPFVVVGMDFAGPFSIKDGRLRNRAIIKAYLCIFICFSTKAVHLEAVTDLSTDSFLNALNRFVARRGLPNVLYSDNATNFVGAHRKLSKVYDFLAKTSKDPAVSEFLLSNSMQWKFIPPRFPHHGGLWEAAVKRAKFHLDRILNNNCLTFEQLATVFAQIEAIMNSRPLTPLSSDPSDLSVLTPGHFLIHYPLLSVPQVDLTSVPSNRLTQYEGLQKLMQTFWRRWKKDYLQQLQTRTKWLESNGTPIREGTLVFLADENTPPLHWKRGRVTKLHPGSDGIVRSVTLRTATGDTTRAVQKLAVLPVDEDDSCWKSLPEASKARGMLRHPDNQSAPPMVPVPCAVRPE